MCCRAAVFVFCISLMPSALAFAACEGKVLMQSNFQSGDSKWPIANTTWTDQAVRDGALTLKYRKNVASQLLYSGDVFDDVQICVNVKLVESVAAEKEYASVVFWAKDYNSYYVLWFDAAGSVGVLRKAGDRWLYPLPPQNHVAVNKGVGQTNALRVALHGNDADLFINERRVGSITGQPVAGGSQVGLRAEGAIPNRSNTVWEFSDYIVSKP
jgi:hypothetical protein